MRTTVILGSSSETKDKQHVYGGKIKPMDLVSQCSVIRATGATKNSSPYPTVVGSAS